MLKFNKFVIKGSFILLIVFNIYSLFNFVFQSSMARLLSVEEYGILSALFYFIYLSSVFSETIQTIIGKYSAKESDKEKLKKTLETLFKKVFLIMLIFFFIYLILVYPIYNIFKINYVLLLLNGLVLLPLFPLAFVRGIMQGKKRFFQLGLSLLADTGMKLVFSILLILIGFGIFGAIGGLIVAFSLSLILSFFLVRDVFSFKIEKGKRINLNFSKHTYNIFAVMLSIFVFFSVDLLIAQRVFDKTGAGYYSILSIIAKIIFWGTNPISKAMFPYSILKEEKQEERKGAYGSALFLLLLCIAFGLGFILLFPNLIIKIFSGKTIENGGKILFLLSLGNSFLAIANLNIIYAISQEKIKLPYLLSVVTLINIILLFYLNETMILFSLSFLIGSITFLISSFLIKRDEKTVYSNSRT